MRGFRPRCPSLKDAQSSSASGPLLTKKDGSFNAPMLVWSRHRSLHEPWQVLAPPSAPWNQCPWTERYPSVVAAMRAPKVKSCLIDGVVSKGCGSPYVSGRTEHWLKSKNSNAPAVKRELDEDWGSVRRRT